MTPLPPFEERDVKKKMAVEAAAGAWVAIHGFLCLALRHPGTAGMSSRAIVEEFVAGLGAGLVKAELLTPAELREAEDVELEAGPACQVCGCTEFEPCEGGCGWDPDFAQQGAPVCTRCAPRIRGQQVLTRADPDWDRAVVALLGMPR